MDDWIKNMLLEKLGESRFEAVERMLRKSEEYKASALKNELEKIVKEEIQ